MNAPLLPLALVVAVGHHPEGMLRPIGRAGKIPWHFSEDMRHFKALTTGHAVIMGRKTFDAIGKPLPNRRNIVVTRTPKAAMLHGLTDPSGGTLEFTYNLHEAIAMAREGLAKTEFGSTFDIDPEPRVIGGGEIYAAAMSWATRIYLTEVNVEVEDADSFFPTGVLADFEEVSRRLGDDPKLAFVELRRKP